MKCLCNVRCKLLKDVDMFGKEPELYYKKRPKKTSWIGRIFSFSFVSLYFAFFIYKLVRMMKKVDVTFYDTFTYSAKPPSVKLNNNNFYGGFALEHPITYDVFIDESIYIPKAYFKRAERKGDNFEWYTEELELERCKLEKFGSHYRDIFKSKTLENLYCFKNIDFTLEGHFTYDLYSFFYIQFFPCINTTQKQNCKPLEEIDFYLKSTFISFQMEDIELTPKNYHSPVRARDVDIYTTVGKNLFKEIHAYFQVVNIETDMDFIGFDEIENIKSEIFLKYDEMIIMSNLIESDIYQTGQPFCDFTIKLSENVRTQRRTYIKLISILGDVGGLMEVLFTLFRIISSFSVDILYEISLVNNLFDFDLEKNQIIMRIQKKTKKNEFPKEEELKIYSPSKSIKVLSSQNSVNINEDIPSTAARMNIGSPKKSKEKITLPSKFKKKKHGNFVKSNITPYTKSITSIGITNNNLFNIKDNFNPENPEEINEVNHNTININNQEEGKEKNKRIVKKIRMNRACIYLCFCFTRRINSIQNSLLDEGMNIITEKLDIFNLFEKLYLEEKMQERLIKDEIIEMSDECKIKIKDILKKIFMY